MSQDKWCQDAKFLVSVHNGIYRMTFPDKGPGETMTVDEVELLVVNIKKFSNDLIGTTVELAIDNITGHLEELGRIALDPIYVPGESAEKCVKTPVVATTSQPKQPADQPTTTTTAVCKSFPMLATSDFALLNDWSVLLGIINPNHFMCSFLIHHKKYERVSQSKLWGYAYDHRICEQLAAAGDLVGLKWFKANCDDSITWSRGDLCKIAARRGHLHVIMWAEANITGIGHWYWREATTGGHLEVLKWFITRNLDIEVSEAALKLAKTLGHAHIVEWLEQMIETI